MCFASSAAKLRNAPDPAVVVVQLWPHMVEHERKDELLDQPEHMQIAGPADLVRDAALLGREPRDGLGAGYESGRNGFEKSSRRSPPIKSSTRQAKCSAAERTSS